MEVSYIQASEIREKLCKILYFCRGANAVVLTQVFNESLNYTQQQKKQITNQLVRLKQARIITSKKLEGKDSGSMYYLSTAGLELVYKLLNINPLQNGSMWQQYPLKDINHEELKEYDYDTYKPPIKQHPHHHLILQSIIKLFGKDSDLPSYPFHLTLDAVKSYRYNNQESLLKPDVEIRVGDEIYTLEVDRSTEYYAQLVAKFKNYKNYLDYAAKKNIETPITKIIFVSDDKNSKHGVSRRWETIMKAFLEGMQIKDNVHKWPKIELVYVQLRDLSKVIGYLKQKPHFDINERWQKLYAKPFNLVKEEPLASTIKIDDCSVMAVTEGNKQLLFGTYYPFYSSELYRQLLMFKNEGKAKFASLDYYSKPQYIPLVISNINKNNWKLNFKGTKVDLDFQYQINYIYNLAQFYSLEG